MKSKAVAYLGGKCALCGYSRCNAAMQFHHLYDKKFGISEKGLSRSWERIKLELDKCLLLCSNCHAEVGVSFASITIGSEQPC